MPVLCAASQSTACTVLKASHLRQISSACFKSAGPMGLRFLFASRTASQDLNKSLGSMADIAGY